MDSFEQKLRTLTQPLNGQYPRPWMTTLKNPRDAKVFLVGYNPAKAYLTSQISHDRHIDALFNRNGEDCHAIYKDLTRESLTRGNIRDLSDRLSAAGIPEILETNVVCYSTAKSKELALPVHVGGKERGREIFRTLVLEIKPTVIIVHGSGVRDEFNRAFREEEQLPKPSTSANFYPESILSNGCRVFVIPSLALPGYQNWPKGNSFCNWADDYLSGLVKRVQAACAS